LAVSTSVVRLGSEAARVGERAATRFWARRRVRRRGESGKLARWVMALSVKSMASWPWSSRQRSSVGRGHATYAGDAEVFYGGDFVACGFESVSFGLDWSVCGMAGAHLGGLVRVRGGG
jgi:hypothetical protein